jgi:isoquinoline 1-oxidoreductase alpha subunit
MASIVLRVNGQDRELPPNANATLQFALRDDLGLTGTKFGCGVGQCGCCTVLIDGQPTRSCRVNVQDVVGKEITTIEGIGTQDAPHPLQQAWIEAQAPQCGYCQSGQIMEAVALLKAKPAPSEQEIRDGLNGHICRCGTYNRIVQAVQLAAPRMAKNQGASA